MPRHTGVPVVKHECRRHVQKRMGKQCRDLRKNKSEVEVVDVTATKRARRKYAKELRAASQGKAAGRSRGSRGHAYSIGCEGIRAFDRKKG